MSDFLAEARVLVRPDTTAFRTLLLAQLTSVTQGVTVPVNVIPVSAGTGAVTGQLAAVQATLANQMAALNISLQTLNSSLLQNASATTTAAASTQLLAGAQQTLSNSTTHATSRFGQFQKGLTASLASLTGLRGAVLAASGPFLAAAVASAAFLKSLQEFADFEQELNVFAATTEATAEQIENVSDLAAQLGRDLSLPAVSATDAATAMTELAKAGLSVEEAMAGARGVLQLSTAAGIGVGEAAQFAANELNAFGLAGDQAVRVADVLANAANAAQGNISDFGLAFKQAAAVANQVGLSLEATAAQLAVMARAGLSGSDAGTSLRVSLLRLINPTKDAQAVIKQLGIDLRDVNGNIRPDVFVQFAEATRRMTPAMRDANAAIVFGADGIRTLAVSAEAGRAGLVDATIAIGEQGSAADLAAARTAGFGGQLEGLRNSASGAALQLGEVATVVAGPLVASLTVLAQALDRTLEPFADLVRLSKEKLGIGTFDATTKSAAELLEALRQVREENITLGKLGEQRGPLEQERIKEVITALQSERDVLRALGVDVTGINDLIRQFQAQLAGSARGLVSALTPAEKAAKNLRELIKQAAADGIDTTALRRSLREIEEQFAALALEGKFAREFGDAFREASKSVDILGAALRRLRGEVAASSDALLKAQNEGASPQAQIALLQGQEQTQREIIANLKANGIGPGDPTAIRAAREEIERIQNEIESLQDGIIADQKAAANEAERKAKEAQEARDKQFEALAEMFGNRQENIEDAIERAGIAGNIQAQIRLNRALVESLQRERAALLERLRTLKVSADVRKKILEEISNAIEDAQQDILRLQEEQRKNIEQFATPGIDIRIRIAQARDNVAAEIALRRQKVELISKELARLKNAGKKNTLAWLELKAQQAEEIAAINELSNQQKTDGKSAQQFFFEQLQAQQGFAANLLGNLITGPTAGLVGVPAPAAPALPDLGARIGAEVGAATGRAQVGPTAGQTNTEIDVLRKIHAELRKLNGSYDAPEAIHQKKVGRADMDGPGHIP